MVSASPGARAYFVLARIVFTVFVLATLLIALLSDPETVTSRLPANVRPFSPSRAARLGSARVEAGDWGRSLYDAISPECPRVPSEEEGGAASLTRMYDGPPLPRTAFASFPRSGSTFTREMVERATGYRTSSMYCDRSLQKTFVAECDRTNSSYFFKKTHYPALRGREPAHVEAREMAFDRAVQVVRNPLDTVFSWWQYHIFLAKDPQSAERHEKHVSVQDLGSDPADMEYLVKFATRWALFHDLWDEAAIPKLTLRYEDMRSSPLPALLSLVGYLLPPPAERPSLSALACALVPDPDRDAYVSQKHSMFSSWDKWDDGARRRLLQITQDGWCRFGYEDDLRRALGPDVETGVDCSSIRAGSLLGANT